MRDLSSFHARHLLRLARRGRHRGNLPDFRPGLDRALSRVSLVPNREGSSSGFVAAVYLSVRQVTPSDTGRIFHSLRPRPLDKDRSTLDRDRSKVDDLIPGRLMLDGASGPKWKTPARPCPPIEYPPPGRQRVDFMAERHSASQRRSQSADGLPSKTAHCDKVSPFGQRR